MSAEMAQWIADTCNQWHAIPFLWIGRYGSHYFLLPFGWKPTAWVH